MTFSQMLAFLKTKNIDKIVFIKSGIFYIAGYDLLKSKDKKTIEHLISFFLIVYSDWSYDTPMIFLCSSKNRFFPDRHFGLSLHETIQINK